MSIVNWHSKLQVLSLDFHPVSGCPATAGADHEIKIWGISSSGGSDDEVPTATFQAALTCNGSGNAHNSAVNVVRFSPCGEYLASGADDGSIIVRKLHRSGDYSEAWNQVHKMLLLHRMKVLDLQWSHDSAFIVSASADTTCVIWDASKGKVHQELRGHQNHVKGEAWDPSEQYIASLSSDRSCKIYANKPKEGTRMNFVCEHTLVKEPVVESHLFYDDEKLPSFFRRLAWSPDGSFLLLPAGISSSKGSSSYIMSRHDLSRPATQLIGPSATVAVRFCPVLFKRRRPNSGYVEGYLFCQGLLQ